jgi:hypothetical protein
MADNQILLCENSQNSNNLASIISHEMETIKGKSSQSTFEELTVEEISDFESFNDIEILSKRTTFLRRLNDEGQRNCMGCLII